MTQIDKIADDIRTSIKVKEELLRGQLAAIWNSAELLYECLQRGNKILLCGNGGSAADAQHIATEYVVRLRGSFQRPALPAVALTTDTSLLTAAANDLGFDHIFARQIEALGQPGDILIAISTSGNSANVINAVSAAKAKQMQSIGWLGQSGGKLKDLVDCPICVPHSDSGRIQESHILIGHTTCRAVEELLFDTASEYTKRNPDSVKTAGRPRE
jgi:D-sedoheptulose 7-phosphate isomerase